MKECAHCHTAKPLAAFRTLTGRPGKTTSYCATCLNSKERSRQQKNRRLIQQARSSCSSCGFDDPRALQFDHLNPGDKCFNIGRGTCKSERSLLEEIAKCRVLCANCHRKHTKDSYPNKAVPVGSKEEQKRQLIQERKTACFDCGLEEQVCLEFDHVVDKTFNISEAPTRAISVEQLKSELAKCEVVCSNCHHIRTRRREEKGRTLNCMRFESEETVQDTETKEFFFVLDIIELILKGQVFDVVRYQSLSSGKQYCRTVDEFNDGRFVPVNHRPC